MRQSLLVISLFILSSCGQRYRSVSEFKMNPAALKNGEKVKLLFWLTGDGNNQSGKYYNQLIVVSQETGDTCNVLVPVNHGFADTDGEKVFTYFSPEDESARLIMMEAEKLAEIKNVSDIKAPAFPKYNDVIYNKDAEVWIRNNYPTVVGFVGTRN